MMLIFLQDEYYSSDHNEMTESIYFIMNDSLLWMAILFLNKKHLTKKHFCSRLQYPLNMRLDGNAKQFDEKCLKCLKNVASTNENNMT